MRTKLNIPALGWLILAVLAGPVHAADRYGYPITDPYAATVIGTPTEFQPPQWPWQDIRYKSVDLTVFQDRELPDLLWFDRRLRNGLLYQPNRAPLMFIIAGTGSSYRSSRTRSLANYFYQAGFHVVTLSSPTHPNFVAAASSTQYPGSLEDDSRDLYRVMELLWEELKEELDVSEFYLTGYSLGATQAAFVARLDDQRRLFDFRKVLMINPAVNLYNSVRILDEMLTRNVPTQAAVAGLIRRITDDLVEVYRNRGDLTGFSENFMSEDILYLAYRDRKPPGKSLAALIGIAFRLSVAHMVFLADVLNNAGYIKPKNLTLYPTDSLTDYLKVAQGVSFSDYYHDLYLPFYLSRHSGLTEQGVIKAESLGSIEGYLKGADKIRVVTNQDELILAPGELDYLRRIFGSRLKVYPYGGHCGNIEYQENVAYMIQFFKN